MSKLVSVIIPTFNRAKVLTRAINSVLNQSYKNIEIIVVDDGSTDSTKNLCSKCSYYYQENAGVSSARNLGIEKANGEFIAFLDSDDEWFSHKIESQVDFLNRNTELNLVHSNEIWIRNAVRVNPPKKHLKGGGDQFLRSLDFCVISPSTVLVRKLVFEKYGMFREDYPVCEDYDFWLKITSCENVGFIKENLINKYGGDEDQLSLKYFAMDYWRIKSLKYIFDQRKLDVLKRDKLLKTIEAKSRILLRGYTKHKNLEHFAEIDSILREISAV